VGLGRERRELGFGGKVSREPSSNLARLLCATMLHFLRQNTLSFHTMHSSAKMNRENDCE
jgi:hypothetical protein